VRLIGFRLQWASWWPVIGVWGGPGMYRDSGGKELYKYDVIVRVLFVSLRVSFLGRRP
jgi:hypothetical protein